MNATETKVVETLSTRPIIWAGFTFSCPEGLYVCDALYHGEAAFFKSTTEVKNIGFVLNEKNDRILLSVIQHGQEVDVSEVRYEDDYSADTGGLFLLNGPVTSTVRSNTLSETIRKGLPSDRLTKMRSSSYGPSRCGNEECFVIQAGWGSGGYDVYHSRTCHILDHYHIANYK